MDHFLLFLVHSIRTIDGNRNSANGLLNLLNRAAIEKYKRDHKKGLISKSVEQKIEQTNENSLFRKIHLKFIIMRVRAKISYMAFIRRMTVLELFLVTIKDTYKKLVRLNLIKSSMNSKNEKEQQKLFDNLFNYEISGFFKAIIEFNRESIKGTFIERNLNAVYSKTVGKEEIETFRFGKKVVKVFDKQANEAKANKISNLVDKNKATVLVG